MSQTSASEDGADNTLPVTPPTDARLKDTPNPDQVQQTPSLMQLPPEIRALILRLVMSFDGMIEIVQPSPMAHSFYQLRMVGPELERMGIVSGLDATCMDIPCLMVSKQMRKECLDALFACNMIRTDTMVSLRCLCRDFKELAGQIKHLDLVGYLDETITQSKDLPDDQEVRRALRSLRHLSLTIIAREEAELARLLETNNPLLQYCSLAFPPPKSVTCRILDLTEFRLPSQNCAQLQAKLQQIFEGKYESVEGMDWEEYVPEYLKEPYY